MYDRPYYKHTVWMLMSENTTKYNLTAFTDVAFSLPVKSVHEPMCISEISFKFFLILFLNVIQWICV